MKYLLVLTALFVPSFAFAQSFPTPGELLLQNAEQCRVNWQAQIKFAQDQINLLSKERDDLKKERDDLKAAAPVAAPAAVPSK